MTIVNALQFSAQKNGGNDDAARDAYNEWQIGVASSFPAASAVSCRNSKELLGGRAQYSTASNPKQITEFSRVHPKNGVNFPTPLTAAKRSL